MTGNYQPPVDYPQGGRSHYLSERLTTMRLVWNDETGEKRLTLDTSVDQKDQNPVSL